MLNPYGSFANDGSAYVIHRHDTPRPWVNYLTNGSYAALCSHRGGGFSFFKDHRYHSLLRRGPQVSYEDLPGRLVYIKDRDTEELWTANVMPFTKCDQFETTHCPGSTEVKSSYRGISSSLRFFVPMEWNAEIWRLRLRNTSGEIRRLSVITLAEFVLGNVSLEDHEAAFMALFNESEIRDGFLIFRKKWWHPHFGWSEENGDWAYRAIMTCSTPFDSALTDRETFFGSGRGYHNPAALESPEFPSGALEGRPMVGAMQWHITLEPGASWSCDLSIGIQLNEESAGNQEQIAQLMDSQNIDALEVRSKKAMEELFARVEVQTPDAEINAFVNHWIKLQAFVNFSHGRGPSYFHKGQQRGMRDTCQDTFGFNVIDPVRARENILRIGHFFFQDGRSGGGCNLIGLPEGPADKADLPLWITLTVADYLRETGDFALLDEELPLLDGGSSTMYQKMVSGIDRMISQQGPHGLPLIGRGDWNDAANGIGPKGIGESVWLAQFLYFILGEVLPICEHMQDLSRINAYCLRREELRERVNSDCWDGHWFVRAFKDDGTPVGVKGQKEGFIWINSQTWAVISGIAERSRLECCMASVQEHLGTPYGLMNLGPAYTKPDDSIGLITRFHAGWKENGGVFSHASAFNVVARALLGKGGDAVSLFKALLPCGKDPEFYLMEPYVFSQFCVGAGDPENHGRGSFHWLTGTASWMFRAMTDHIMGVRAEKRGLRIDPSVDPSWKTFSMKREFRGATYQFHFENPMGVEHGVQKVFLNGTLLPDNLVPLEKTGCHEVRVQMGALESL